MYSLLIVDDEAATREGLIRLPLWGPLGIRRILQAADGREALEILERERPDILLTDVKMPYMEGTVLAQHARARFEDLKIVFISGYDDVGYVKSALTVAAYDYIFKPVDVSELERCFDRVVTQLNAERTSRSELERLVARSRAGERVVRDHLLHLMLACPPVDHKELTAALSTLGIAPVGKQLTVLALRVLGSGRGQDVLGLLKPEGMTSYPYVLDHTKGLYALLLETERPIPFSQLSRIAQGVLWRLQAQGIAYAAIGLEADGSNRMDQLGALYRKAEEALAHCLYQPAFTVQAFHEIPAAEKAARPKPLGEAALLEPDGASLDAYLKALADYFAKSRRPDEAFYLQAFGQAVEDVYAILAHHFRFTAEEDALSPAKVLEDLLSAPCLPPRMDRLAAYCREASSLLRSENDVGVRQSIHRIVQYVQEHYGRPLTTADLAAQAYLTPTYLSMLFHREMGITLNAYVTKVRMERAKLLLKDPALKQYDIGVSVGYSNPSYFVRKFKQYVGVTPSEYRNRYLGGNR